MGLSIDVSSDESIETDCCQMALWRPTWRSMGSYKWAKSRVTIIITHIRGLITLLITTHEPPSTGMGGFTGLVLWR